MASQKSVTGFSAVNYAIPKPSKLVIVAQIVGHNTARPQCSMGDILNPYSHLLIR